mmetsp:Transcript_58648/g.71732  ORF Transcript_58648/g.71732 Transcript_58648/m.71732 type:complete len:284 (-) Transcript_58648:362-1213(-)
MKFSLSNVKPLRFFSTCFFNTFMISASSCRSAAFSCTSSSRSSWPSKAWRRCSARSSRCFRSQRESGQSQWKPSSVVWAQHSSSVRSRHASAYVQHGVGENSADAKAKDQTSSGRSDAVRIMMWRSLMRWSATCRSPAARPRSKARSAAFSRRRISSSASPVWQNAASSCWSVQAATCCRHKSVLVLSGVDSKLSSLTSPKSLEVVLPWLGSIKSAHVALPPFRSACRKSGSCSLGTGRDLALTGHHFGSTSFRLAISSAMEHGKTVGCNSVAPHFLSLITHT